MRPYRRFILLAIATAFGTVLGGVAVVAYQSWLSHKPILLVTGTVVPFQPDPSMVPAGSLTSPTDAVYWNLYVQNKGPREAENVELVLAQISFAKITNRNQVSSVTTEHILLGTMPPGHTIAVQAWGRNNSAGPLLRHKDDFGDYHIRSIPSTMRHYHWWAILPWGLLAAQFALVCFLGILWRRRWWPRLKTSFRRSPGPELRP